MNSDKKTQLEKQQTDKSQLEKEQDKIELKEVCSVCGKPKAVASGSLTGWTLQDSKCKCAEPPVGSAIAVLDQGDKGEQKTLPPKRTLKSDGSSEKADALIDSQALSFAGLDERYDIIEKLGEGGMGTVYKVKDKQLGKTLAIKVLRNELAIDQKNVERFEQEVKASMNLTHPNLIAVYAQGATNTGAPYLVMDFVDGQSLSEIIEEKFALSGGVPHSRIVDIFLQVADGLEHAHNKGVVHRDIKPSNILVTSTEDHLDFVKLVDFGIAKILPESGLEVRTLTSTGDIFGSPLYMSPEQGQGARLDRRSDFYSLGCVLYESLTGKPPFEAENPIQTILAHLNDPPARLEMRLGVSEDLEAVMMKCLAKKPDDRYQHAHELRADLELIKAGQKTKARTLVDSRMFRKRLRKIGLIAGCIILLAGLGFLWYLISAPPWITASEEAGRLSQIGSSHYGEAEALYVKALADADKSDAPDNDKEYILYNLGQLYFEWGRQESAAQTFEKALAVDIKHPPDLQTATIYDYLCDINNDWAKPKIAQEQGEKALAIRRKEFAHHPLLVANTLLHLSTTYRQLKENDKAAADARECASIYSKQKNVNAPLLAKSYMSLCDALFADQRSVAKLNGLKGLDKSKIDETEQAAKKAVALLMASRGPTDWVKDRTRWLANNLIAFHRTEAADQICKEGGIASGHNFALAQFTVSLPDFVIIDITTDGPAYKAGLRDRDKLVQVDKLLVEDSQEDEVLTRIRQGGSTKIVVDRGGENMNFELNRK